MTHEEWKNVFDLLLAKASKRKARLFAVACCRRFTHLMPAPQYGQIIDATEQLADRDINEDEYDAIRQRVVRELSTTAPRSRPLNRRNWESRHYQTAAFDHLKLGSVFVALDTVSAAAYTVGPAGSPEWNRVLDEECAALRDLLIDVVGPSTRRPINFTPWLTSTVRALAEQMYQSRDFSTMPILADALQDAGCNSELVLNHCREPGYHVRGCWVVDRLLHRS